MIKPVLEVRQEVDDDDEKQKRLPGQRDLEEVVDLEEVEVLPARGVKRLGDGAVDDGDPDVSQRLACSESTEAEDHIIKPVDEREPMGTEPEDQAEARRKVFHSDISLPIPRGFGTI